VLDAIGDRREVIVVAHSFGGATIGLVREARPELPLVYVTALVLEPGVSALDSIAGGRADPDDPFAAFGGLVVDRGEGLCELDLEVMAAAAPEDRRDEYLEALRRTQREQGIAALAQGWPGSRVPSGRTWYVVATQDTMLPVALQRQMAEALGATVFEVDSDHEVFIETPDALAAILARVADDER
jgi:pimeloyl-ACP methyl ester carboxylesterase